MSSARDITRILQLQLWFDLPQRPTRDADFLGFGDAEPKALAEIFRGLTLMTSPELVEDGVEFLSGGVFATAAGGQERKDPVGQLLIIV